MANLFSNYALDYTKVDLSLLVRNQVNSNLLSNVNLVFNGRTYEDVAEFVYYTNTYYSAIFGGYGFSTDAAGNVAGGTLTGYLESFWNGSSYTTYWGIEDISFPALSLSNTAFTTSNADDISAISQILSGNDIFGMSNFDDVVNGFSGNDAIYGFAGNDYLLGGDGNDLLSGGDGNDTLNGGLGIDIASYQSILSEYSVTENRVVDRVYARDGSDTLSSIERLRFTNVNVAFDVGYHENAGMAYRMYKAAFDRVPDAEGLGFWINALDLGYSLEQISNVVTTTPEFLSVYGQNSSNRTFVNLLYQHVLHREADEEGFNFWNDALNSGYSRGAVMAVYTETPENLNQTAPLVASGIQYQEWIG